MHYVDDSPHPCTIKTDNHKIRFMDRHSSGPTVFFSTKTLEELQVGVILVRLFQIIKIEHRVSEEGVNFCLFTARNIHTQYEREFVAEAISTSPMFNFDY